MSSQESVTMVETAGFHAVYEKANGFDDFRKPAITVLREEDAELAQAEFLSDLQLGLNSKSKHLSSLYFYDDLGSRKLLPQMALVDGPAMQSSALLR
mmetsp:Transcript_6249/g.26470  ORF Transcript_6249/g.26470 Transcript_6249/m.26470 type:complete len:97 (+) Transcript_6249:301-591(+)